MTAPCDSCGAGGEEGDLQPVHRVYLELDRTGQVTGEKVLAEVERWCPSCRSLYPNRPWTDDGRGGGRSRHGTRPPGAP